MFLNVPNRLLLTPRFGTKASVERAFQRGKQALVNYRYIFVFAETTKLEEWYVINLYTIKKALNSCIKNSLEKHNSLRLSISAGQKPLTLCCLNLKL